MREYTHVGTVWRDEHYGPDDFVHIPSELYICPDCGCVVGNMETHDTTHDD